MGVVWKLKKNFGSFVHAVTLLMQMEIDYIPTRQSPMVKKAGKKTVKKTKKQWSGCSFWVYGPAFRWVET